MSVLKLVGKDFEYMGGVLELYPINGKLLLFIFHLTCDWWRSSDLRMRLVKLNVQVVDLHRLKNKYVLTKLIEPPHSPGSATVEREDLSASLVRDIRNYFQISPEYFSMLLVGKDGNIKSWYPSPMWSMSTIYDLVDSMQLRRQEMAIQQSLGMRCPDDDYGHGYHEQDHRRGYGY